MAKSCNCKVSIVDTDTGEILGKASKTVTFFGFADGEKMAFSWFNSFLRGCSKGRNLSMTINVSDVSFAKHVENPRLF